MELERDIPDAPLETRDRLVLLAMQTVYRNLKRRPYWYPGYGIAEEARTPADLLQDWMSIVNGVRHEIEMATLFDADIETSDWPDIPACIVLAIQSFLRREIPKEPPPPLAVETWRMVCAFLTMGLLEQRQLLMGIYMKDLVDHHKEQQRIGPAFDPAQVPQPEAA